VVAHCFVALGSWNTHINQLFCYDEFTVYHYVNLVCDLPFLVQVSSSDTSLCVKLVNEQFEFTRRDSCRELVDIAEKGHFLLVDSSLLLFDEPLKASLI
jgi:hypothetical protein